jgi:hypothetical protein
MYKKVFILMVLLVLALTGFQNVLADDTDLDTGYPWRNHAPPFNFRFGNMIDSHQQTMEVDGGLLSGFIYIYFNGETTSDGIPKAQRANCALQDCSVGWAIQGVPVRATLLQKGPRFWYINSEDMPSQPGYTHFQWVGDPRSPHDLVTGEEYDGILMRRIAPQSFFWLGNVDASGGHSGGESCDGCSGSDGGCTGDTGGCSGSDGSCTGGDGGCVEGSCGGHEGRLVSEGIDPHSNITTNLNATWSGCSSD